MQLIRQNSGTGAGSGITISVGPCLDSTGAEYTGLVIGDLTLVKNGTSAALASAATLTATSNGHYDLVTIGNNADTLGRVRIRCNKSGYQIPPLEFMVLPATVYDALVTNATNTNGGFLAATAATTVGANVGTSQPVNFFGTGGDACVKSDVILIDNDDEAASQLLLLLADNFLAGIVAAIKERTDRVPDSPASTTNIIEGTITTVENLTTNNDKTNYGLSESFLSEGGPRTWYVAEDSDGDGDTGTRSAPCDTYEQAEALASAGDTIAFLDTYNKKVNVTKSGLTLTSAGGSISYAGDGTISDTLGAVYVAPAVNFTTLYNLKIAGTNSEYGVGVKFGNAFTAFQSSCNRIIDCDILGRFDALELSYQTALEIRNCRIRSFSSSYDGGNANGCTGVIENTTFSTDGSSVAESINVIFSGNRAFILFDDNYLTFKSCRFIATRAIASVRSLGALGLCRTTDSRGDGACTFENCSFYVDATNASDTGRIYGIGVEDIGSGRLPFNFKITGGRFYTATAGSTPDSGPWDIDIPTGSVVEMTGPAVSNLTKCKTAGTARIEWTTRNVTDALADTNELQIDNADGGRTDVILDAAAASAASADGKLPIRLKKNTAFASFPFYIETNGGAAATGKTVTAQRSLDGAAFATCTNSVSEIANGWYKISLAAGDLNANSVGLKFTASGCKQRNITIITQV